MSVNKGIINLGAAFTLLATLGCAAPNAPTFETSTPVEPVPATAERLDRHVITHGEYSVELDCSGEGTVEAELLKNGARQADYEYKLEDFSRKFAKHMRNLDRFNLIPKDTRRAIVGRAQQISGLCDGP